MAVNAVISLIALVLFVCLFYGPWQAVCTDWARQFVFERRDHLFDLAAKGQLAFDSEEYRAVRKLLEGMIRFAHNLSWPRFAAAVLARGHTLASRPTTAETIEHIQDPATRKQVNELVFEATVALIVMMALKSIFVAPFVFIFCLITVCSSGVKRLVRRASVPKNITEAIQDEARFA